MLDAYRDLIDELLGTPSEIRAMVAERSADADSPEARRLIAGIRNRDRAVLSRVQAMTREREPYLRELQIDAPDDDEAFATLLSEMETARGDLVSLLINLSLKDWEREAIHERGGAITLADEVEAHVEFDEAQRRAFRELMTRA